MNIKNQFFYIKLISVILSAAVLISSVSVFGFAQEETQQELSFATLSDISFVSQENRGGYNEAFLLDAKANGYQYEQIDSLIDSSFEAIKQRVEKEDLKYLLVNGNLTYSGEYTNHVAIAEKLLELEEQTGVNVIVCNGPTDANSATASSFKNGSREYVTPATASQFKTIYSELGYDIAANKYNAFDQNSAGLSYSVELDGGYRLIVIDATYFEYRNGHNAVSGRISNKLLEWIKTECTIARHAGQTLIGMCSWSLGGDDITGSTDYILNGDKLANTLADAGMHYIFTAGTGKNDIATVISDKGNIIFDVQSAGLISFPNTFRVSTFKGQIADFEIADVDEVKPIVSRKGIEYEQPYREKASLRVQFNDYDLAAYCADVIKNYITSILVPGVEQNKTLEGFVSSQYGISLTEYINGLMNGGINILNIVVFFDATNIMNLLEDIYLQSKTTLLKDPQKLADICYARFRTAFDSQVSSKKCDKFLADYGFGSKDNGGTLNDLILSMYVYSKCGNEDSGDDEFIKDVSKNLKSGKLVTFIAEMLGETIIRDLLFNDILSQLQMKPQYLIFLDDTPDSLGYYLQIAFKAYLAFTGNDSSITGSINGILKTGVLSEYGKSIEEVIDYFVNYYFDDENAVLVGEQLADIFNDYVTDTDPQLKGDYDVTYDGNKSAESYASRENFRIPTMVTVTPGNKTQTETYVTWYTKSTVEGSNLEIYDDKDSVFYGKHFIGVDGVSIVTANNDIERTFARLNLGFISLGEQLVGLTQHTMKITGLEPGKTYYMRVGDSSKNWWSETVTFTTADDSETLSFIHVSDTMGDSEKDFNVFANILNCAEYIYPESDFVLHTGNYIDDNKDLKQWQKLLDGISENLLSSYLVPVAGSNDTTDTIKQNFAIGSLLGESEKTGVYYSFDYNLAHIVVLDSNCIEKNGKLKEEQLEWLENDMGKTQAKWKIVAIHDPVYTNGDYAVRETQSAYMKYMTALMEEYNVDIVLTGSDGVYYRTDGMYKNEVTDQVKVSYPHQIKPDSYYRTIPNPVGVMYSSLASSGIMSSEMHNINDVEFPESGFNTNPKQPMFSAIEIYGDTLYLTSYTVSGNRAKKIDSISIKKGATGTGDVNYDGKVTAADARLILRATAQLEYFTADQLKLADITGDGKVTAADARRTLRRAAGLE
ncbi:MAG: fibronectin type III domain-containing protein [Clostridia bacterium]|nr:fibronectin type III domain-containing protein [Clostridia bacterium]